MKNKAWVRTMQAPVAPSIRKTMVPSAADTVATLAAITSIRSKPPVE